VGILEKHESYHDKKGQEGGRKDIDMHADFAREKKTKDGLPEVKEQN
jgi:hypothetical protein